MASDDFEKTLPPSERKLQKAKEDGNGLKLQDLTLLGSFFCIVLGYSMIWERLSKSLTVFKNVSIFWSLQGIAFEAFWGACLNFLGLALIPVAACSLIMSIASWLVGGQILSIKAISFDLDRVDPIKKLGSMFQSLGSSVGWPLVKGLIMIVITLMTTFFLFKEFSQGGVRDIWDVLLLCSYIGTAFVVFAGFDSAVQWWKRSQELMMSYQEVQDEMKETEGNPQIKWRQRSLARERSKARMMSAVAKSDVVIVNPEHYLVALKWDKQKDSAPRVIAKGRNEIALNLKKKAQESGVPVLEMPPLARSIWHNVSLDKTVPEHFYKAVAMVFAWVARIEQGLDNVELKEEQIMEGLPRA